MHQRLRVSYFVFETLPPPLRGPPPSTEGGEGCNVALNVGRLSCSRRVVGKSNFYLKWGTPSPPAAELPPRKEPLQDDLLRVAALIDLWLLHYYKTPPTLVGGHSVHPRSWESNFVFETLPPPLRGPPPSTEGGEGWCASAQTRRGALRAPAFVGKELFL